jgi:hypothetical protein
MVAAACSNEVLKYVTGAAPCVDNWMAYNGQTGIASSALAMSRSVRV